MEMITKADCILLNECTALSAVRSGFQMDLSTCVIGALALGLLKAIY